MLSDLELYAGMRNVLSARHLWRPILRLLRPYAWRLTLLVALSGFSLAMTLVQPFLFREVLDGAAALLTATDEAVAAGARAGLVRAAVLLVVLGILNVTSTLIAARYQGYLGQSLLYDIQGRLFDRVQRMPYGFFIHVNPGAVINRVSSEAANAATAVPSVVSGGFVTVATLVFGTALIARFDPMLAGVLVFLSLFAFPARWVRRVVRKKLQEQYVAQGDYTGAMQERLSVSGALLTRLFGLYEQNSSRFLGRAKAYRDLGVSVALWQGFAQSLISMGTIAAVGAIALVGGLRVGAGAMTIGTLALLLFYVRILSAPIQSYNGLRFELTRAMVAFGRVFEVLEFEPAMTFPEPGSVAAQPVDGSVAFRDVRFAYPNPYSLAPVSLVQADARPDGDDGGDDEEVLRGVTFDVPDGGFTAVVGASGAGKSTIAALVARLFDVTEGSVMIGGLDVREIDQPTLTAMVGLVTQDTHLFHDTIRANLLLAKPDATDKEVVRACMAAGIHKFIRDLPAGYATLVGERGVRFSGGQRQRIAFARAVLADPRIIVLDEATAHLDAEAESLLREAVEKVLADRTRIVIAHRLSTVVDADQILVLDGGIVADRGTHEELIARPGRYRDLYRTQLTTQPTPSAPTPALLQEEHA